MSDLLAIIIGGAPAFVLVWSWCNARDSREDMRAERDNAVAEASKYRELSEASYRAASMAVKRAEAADIRSEFLASLSGASAQSEVKDSRAVRTLQAELAAARKVLSENGLLGATHKGGEA